METAPFGDNRIAIERNVGGAIDASSVAADTADTPIVDEWSPGSGAGWANRRCEGDWPVPALPFLFGPSFSLLAALAALDSLLCAGTGIEWNGVPLPLSAGWLIGGGQIVEDGCSVGLFSVEPRKQRSVIRNQG